MLHRSFKPAKCKTALKLAASRIKLLKNKREAQVKQLRRELAQLLESGQDQTARIRVEHVVREEKTMAAYDLVEIYCELIAARLPIIESQKNCPIDLKEAVASIIFASPRCADIPELMDVRKHFTAKYGKEFVSAAVEIRPDCGVSRLLVEKLSAKAPDGPTKLKILTAIAEEHNIKWDPKSFGEKDNKPAEDLLNGPNTFEQSSTFQVGPPNVQDSANSADMGAHNYHVPSQQYVKHDVPANSHDPDLRSSPHSQNFPHRDVGADKTMPLGASRTNPRPPGTGPGEVEHRHSYAPDQSGPPSSTQSWNMEFKDATSAAQAAAESAERASMAARAAAELSSQGRITRQQSTESLKGSSFVSRDEGPQNHTGLKIQGEQFSKDRPSGTYHKKNPEMYRDQSHGYEQDDLAGLTERFNNLKSSNNSSQTAFSKPSSAYMDDYHSMNEPQMPVRHSRNSSSELQRSSIFGETSVNQESSKSEVDFVDEVEGGMGSENVGYFEDESIRKQASSISLKFHSRTFSDDHNLFSNTYQQQSNEKTVVDDERIQRDAKEANSHDNPVVFDDSGSENDEFMFDVENKNNGRELFSSEDGQSSSHLLANANAWGPRQNMDESLGKSSSQTLFASEKHCNAFFSEDLTSDPVPSQLLPVTFDESDGSDSESEVELDASGSEVVHSSSTGIVPHSERVSARISDPTHSGNPRLIGSSLADDGILKLECKTHQQEFSHDSNTGEIFSEETHGIGANDETDSKFAYGNLYMAQTSPIDVKFSSRSNNLKDNLQASGRSSVEGNVQSYQTPIAAKDVEPIEESSLETGTELNFGVLTGGLRNKGYRRPPYSRNLPDIPSPEQATEDSSARTRQSSSSKVDISSRASDQESYNQMVHREVDKKTSLKNPVRSSDSDDSDEDLPQQKFSSSQESYSKKAAIEANEPLSTKAYFDSDNSASEEVISKNTSTRKRHPGTGFSRRTKLSPSSFDRDSFSQATMLSKSSVNAEDLVESKSSSGSSYATETQQKPQSPTRSSDYRGSFGQHRSTEQAASKRIQQSKRSSHEDSPSRSSYATGVQQSPLPQSKGSDYWASSGQRRSSEPEAPKRIPESKRSSHEDSSSRSPYAIDVQQSQLSQSKGSDYRASSGQRRSSEPEAPQRIPESKRSSREDSSSRSPYAINVQQSPLSQSKGSDYRASSGQHRSSEPAAPKPIPESKKSLREENLKSSTQQQLSNPPPKTVAAGNTGSSKTSSSHGETPSRENSINKASHVHPKLPDWDTFAERLQSIRQNLQ